MRVSTLILFFLTSAAIAAEDPRLKIDTISACVEAAKSFMPSTEFADRGKEQDLIGACRDVDVECVQEVGETFRPRERVTAENFVPLVRACRGRGMGTCLREMKSTVLSYDRREANQITELLKKCE